MYFVAGAYRLREENTIDHESEVQGQVGCSVLRHRCLWTEKRIPIIKKVIPQDRLCIHVVHHWCLCID